MLLTIGIILTIIGVMLVANELTTKKEEDKGKGKEQKKDEKPKTES